MELPNNLRHKIVPFVDSYDFDKFVEATFGQIFSSIQAMANSYDGVNNDSYRRIYVEPDYNPAEDDQYIKPWLNGEGQGELDVDTLASYMLHTGIFTESGVIVMGFSW